ncbi:UNVERIFIED_CONTAM: hypothetical protein K2H54_062679 [Gekko kuhli]
MGAGSSAEARNPQDTATAAGASQPSSPAEEAEPATAALVEPEQLEEPAKRRGEVWRAGAWPPRLPRLSLEAVGELRNRHLRSNKLSSSLCLVRSLAAEKSLAQAKDERGGGQVLP